MSSAVPWNEGSHAIVQAAFAVSFSSPVTPKAIREMIGLHSRISEAYPRKQDLSGRRVGLGFRANEPPIVNTSEEELNGFHFDSLRPNGETERAITLERDNLSVIRADYTNWESIWKEVSDIFSLLLPSALERHDILAFHLQYQDRFRWLGERNDFRAEHVFRSGNPYLAPHVFEVDDLWHCYHGYFENLTEPQEHQQLTVIEAQALAPPEETVFAQLQINHRVTPKEGLSDQEAIMGKGDSKGLLDAYMNIMHDANKQVLRHLLNDEMCDVIGLRGD